MRHTKENVKAQIGGSLSPSIQHNGIKEGLKGRGEGNSYSFIRGSCQSTTEAVDQDKAKLLKINRLKCSDRYVQPKNHR